MKPTKPTKTRKRRTVGAPPKMSGTRNAKPVTPRHLRRESIEADLIASMREAVAIKRGTLTPAREYSLPKTAREAHVAEPKRYASSDVFRVRSSLGLSQTVFARALAKSPATIRSWEQGQREPDPASNRLLEIAERHPNVILELVGRRT